MIGRSIIRQRSRARRRVQPGRRRHRRRRTSVRGRRAKSPSPGPQCGQEPTIVEDAGLVPTTSTTVIVTTWTTTTWLLSRRACEDRLLLRLARTRTPRRASATSKKMAAYGKRPPPCAFANSRMKVSASDTSYVSACAIVRRCAIDGQTVEPNSTASSARFPGTETSSTSDVEHHLPIS